jgi:hypothetical protein
MANVSLEAFELEDREKSPETFTTTDSRRSRTTGSVKLLLGQWSCRSLFARVTC